MLIYPPHTRTIFIEYKGLGIRYKKSYRLNLPKLTFNKINGSLYLSLYDDNFVRYVPPFLNVADEGYVCLGISGEYFAMLNEKDLVEMFFTSLFTVNHVGNIQRYEPNIKDALARINLDMVELNDSIHQFYTDWQNQKTLKLIKC